MATKTGKSGSWNWNDANAWVEGAWVDGDIATIPTGGAYTIPAGVTIAAGVAGNPTNTTVVSLSGTAILNILGTLQSYGDVIYGRGSTVDIKAGGIITLFPQAGAVYKVRSNTGGSGQALLKTSGTGWGAGEFATIQDGGAGGVSIIVAADATYLYGNTDFAYLKCINLGDTTNLAFYQYGFSAGALMKARNILFLDCSEVKYTCANGNNLLDIDGLDKRDISRTLGTNTIQFGSNTAKTSGTRYVKNLTLYSTKATSSVWATYGSSISYENIVVYNVTHSHTAQLGLDIYKAFSITDIAVDPAITSIRGYNSKLRDSIILMHMSNPHFTTMDTVDSCLFDGDNYDLGNGDVTFTSSTGAGPTIVTNCIAINAAGVLTTAWGTSASRLTSKNNTIYRSNLINSGETTGADGTLGDIKNNLIVHPHLIYTGIAYSGAAGVPQGTGNFNLDYNCSWDSSSVGGYTLATYKNGHPLAGQTGYLQGGGTFYVNWWSDGRVLGDPNAGEHDIKADPKFKNPSWTVRGYFGLSTVRDVAKEAISINGIDWQGNPTTATTKTPADVLAAARDAFTPTNKALKGAGEGGVDIGAVPVVVKQSSGRSFSGSLRFRL